MANVAIIDDHAHPTAPLYYSTFDEPIIGKGAIHVDSIVRLPGMRLDQLLQAIADTDAGSTIIIVSHGTLGGMVIPMSKSTKVKGFPPEAAAELLRYFKHGSSDEPQLAKNLKMPLKELQDLKALATAARAKKPARLVFRACRLGSYTSDLDRLRELFGAEKAEAPDLYDSYVIANPNPTTNAGVWKAWLRKYTGYIIVGKAPDRFAYQHIRYPHNFDFNSIADNWTAIQDWVTQNLGAPPKAVKDRFPVHALQNGKLVFPLQDEYKQHLHEVPEPGLP